MVALGIRGKDANAVAVPLAHGWDVNRAAESPPPSAGIDRCKMVSTLPSLISSFVMMFVGAIVGRKIKYRTVLILAMLCLLTGGMLPIVWNSTFYCILGARAIFGLGMGFIGCRNALVIASFPENKRSKFLGLGVFVGNSCGVLLQIIAGWLADIGLRQSFLVYAIALLPLLLVLFCLKEPEGAKLAAKVQDTHEKVQIKPRVWLYIAILFVWCTLGYRYAARDHIPLHWHSELQFTWVFEGALSYTVGTEHLTLSKEHVLLVNAGRLHGSEMVQSDTKTLCINFTPEIFPVALLRRDILPLLEKPAFSYAVLPVRPQWLEILNGCCAKEEAPDCFAVYELLTQLLRALTREFHGMAGRKDGQGQRFQTALNYLHTHYNQPLSAKELALAAAVNRTELGMLFKKYAGMTPAHYRNQYRLYMAKRMIVGTDRPITEICAETGYN